MIHQYKLNGYNIVLDVFSGSIHIPDDAAYDAIRLIDEGRTKEEAETILAETYRDRGITVPRPKLRHEAEEHRCQGALPPCRAHLQPEL